MQINLAENHLFETLKINVNHKAFLFEFIYLSAFSVQSTVLGDERYPENSFIHLCFYLAIFVECVLCARYYFSC